MSIMPMQVPEHIYLDGGSTGTRVHSFTAPDSREILTVPDRITLAGNGGHVGMKATPGKDLIRDRIDSIAVHESGDVPPVLTASQMSVHEAPSAGPSNADSISRGSSAIDENPLKELKLLRRRMGQLSTRLLDLEEENLRRQAREYGLWAALLGIVGMFASLILKKR